jgi:hypothetical protein
MVVATAKSRARHCAQYAPTTLRALEHGTQRLVLVVHAFTPPEPPDGTLVVWLASDGKAPPQEVARVAIHPVRAFTRADGKDQRFAVSLAGQSSLPAPGTPLCLEVGFDTAARTLSGGRAETEIMLEVPDPG